MPAGPLLNGRWLLHYSQLGFDILTYKTVRSRYRECYSMPNLQPVLEDPVESGQVVTASQSMTPSWAISFGMPSMEPSEWRQDLEWTRKQLDDSKIMVVSVVATPEPHWTLDDVADDYAKCARWANESGADAIELNFSCPNVASVDGQLYQTPQAAEQVVQEVRSRIGQTPLIVKIGHMIEAAAIARLIKAFDGIVNGIAMVNCLACQVKAGDQQLFDGQPRGIGGAAIRRASIAQVAAFAKLVRESNANVKLIGVGGISTAEHVQHYLHAGAETVQIATAAMLDPLVGVRIRGQLSKANTD
jgi:dihydroorotate dehydrogenase